MKNIKLMPVWFLVSLFLLSGPVAWAQGRSNDKKENKEKVEKENKKNQGKEKGPDRYSGNNREKAYDEQARPRTDRQGGDILGRVILPPKGTRGPRRLQGVPPGHYPRPGECRIWYPNRPPGHQPPATACRNLVGVRLEPGAFVLHGDRAYDAEYDWREEERRRPGSVGRDIQEILFPRRRYF